MDIEKVKIILSNIDFAKHSCLDMNYQFDVKVIEDLYFIRTSFQRKDINDGKFGLGWGRWHTTPVANATETSIVMTAWVCIKMVVEHELLEGFCYLKEKVFNPHKSIDELIYPNKLPDER